MNENFDPRSIESAEKKYFIDPESGYYNALSFVSDPVKYFSAYRQQLIDEGFEDSDICQQALAEMAELEDILGSQDIPMLNSKVKEMLNVEYGSEAWVKITFGILKDAGFTKEQAFAWVILEDEELTNEELLKERTQRYFIKALFEEL